jgi:ABC-type sulfate/molybdate transport systems ATPase subunit
MVSHEEALARKHAAVVIRLHDGRVQAEESLK